MYLINLKSAIDCPPERVWQALCKPEEVALWDDGVSGAIDAPPDYPEAGQEVHWRCRAGPWPVLVDRPREVEPAKMLRSELRLGPYEMAETYQLRPVDGGGCELEVMVALRRTGGIPGWLITNLYAGRSFKHQFQHSMNSLKQHCETVSRSEQSLATRQEA